MKGYKKLKAAGVVALISTPTGIIIQRSKWNPDTGQPETPELVAVDEAALAEERAALTAEMTTRVAEIDELLADVENKKKKPKKGKL